MSGRPRIDSFIKDTLCNHCDNAKDRVNNRYVNGCYCIHYGYIVSKQIVRCTGYAHSSERVNRDDGTDTGSNGENP